MSKKNQVKIFLSQEEAQALIMASYNMKSDLSKLKNKNQLAVGWRILWEDLENGIGYFCPYHFCMFIQLWVTVFRYPHSS